MFAIIIITATVLAALVQDAHTTGNDSLALVAFILLMVLIASTYFFCWMRRSDGDQYIHNHDDYRQ